MEPRLSHVAIMVDALEDAIDFYGRAFGFRLLVVKGLPEIGVRSAFLAAGSAVFVELVEYSGKGGMPAGSTVIALEVDDLDAAVAQLKTGGVDVVVQRKTDNIPYRRGWITADNARGTVFELCPTGEVARFVASLLAAAPRDGSAGHKVSGM